MKSKGFTIIEVVLVLAIAGLIFLVVFLAFPTLQKSQQDSQRKSDMGKLSSQVKNYQSNNEGNLPAATVTAWNTFIANYLRSGGDTFADPEGNNYSVTSVTSTIPASMPTLTAGNVLVYTSATCGGTVGVQSSTNPRNVALVTYLSQGGFYCQGD